MINVPRKIDKNQAKCLMLDFAMRLVQADVDKMKGVDNPDIGKMPTVILEELLDKYFDY